MPSIQSAISQNKSRISAGGETNAWAAPPTPPASTPFIIGPTPPQDLPVGGGLPQRAMYPAQFVLASDRSDSSRGFRTGGMRAPAFPYPNPSSVSEKVTSITEIVQSTAASTSTSTPAPTSNPVTPPPTPAAGAVLLETNGIANIVQDELNLASGSAISLAADGTGDVVISSPVFGPSGPGHSTGAVPDPGPSAGTTHFLREDGAFAIPPGTGGATNYQEVENNGTPVPAEPILNFLSPLVATDNPGNTSTDVRISIPFSSVALVGNVSGSAVLATVCSIAVTMPAKGGPWRVLINWNVMVTMITNRDVTFWINDGTNNFRFVHVNGQSSDNTGASQGLMSPFTYADGATVTFALKTIGAAGASYSIVAADPVGSGSNSGMDISVFPSS